MTVEALKNARLSEATAGYLAIYLKLSDLFSEASKVTGLIYYGREIDEVNDDFYNAMSAAMSEAMKLVNMSIAEKISWLDNDTEI